MVDINDDAARVRGRVEIRTGIGRRRQWTDEEKGRIVAEAIGPRAVIAEVTGRHDLTPQHLSNWIRAAKDGKFALPEKAAPAFVPVVVEAAEPQQAAPRDRSAPIVIMIGDVRVRVPGGAEARTVEAVLRAVRRVLA